MITHTDSVSLVEGVDYLSEQIKTIRNLCDTSLELININRRDLLPTILELLFQEAQSMVNDYCIK